MWLSQCLYFMIFRRTFFLHFPHLNPSFIPFLASIHFHLLLGSRFSYFCLISLLTFDYFFGINRDLLHHTTPYFTLSVVVMWLSHKPLLSLSHHLKTLLSAFYLLNCNNHYNFFTRQHRIERRF